MNKKARVTVYEEDAVYFSAALSDFGGGIGDWKECVYELFRWNMTWCYAHKIDVRESRSSGVYVSIIAKPAYESQVAEMMQNIGFRNVKSNHESIGAIECTDLPEDMLVDFVDVDY